MKFKGFLNELVFQNSKDRDFPVSGNVIIFDPREKYDLRGKTHGLESHAIKHLAEFDPTFYNNILHIVKSYILSKRAFILKNGIPSLITETGQISNDDIINTLDRVNDKLYLKERLTPEEMEISNYIHRLAIRYEEIINEVIKNPVTISSSMTGEQIEAALRAKRPIKFIVWDRDVDLVHIYNPTYNAVVIEYKDRVRSMFTLKKPGWYALNAKKFYNDALKQIMITK